MDQVNGSTGWNFSRTGHRSRNWIITGSTGFIGREMVLYLLAETQDDLTLLIRRGSGGCERDPTRRMIARLKQLTPASTIDLSRIKIIESDVTRPFLGLSQESIADLFSYENYFIHLAGNTNFTESIAVSRLVNVEGVRSALSVAEILAENGCLAAFGYVSTAFVHGSCSGRVDVAETINPERARNAYERSKCEAEILVRSRFEHLPIVIFRPSIVVGNSRNGRASGTNTVYWALKLYLAGHRRFFANRTARLDLVPVDFVTSTICYLIQQRENTARCFPLVAGPERDISIGQFATAAATHFDLLEPTFLNPRTIELAGNLLRVTSPTTRQRAFLAHMLSYLPYFTFNPQFEDSETAEALSHTTMRVPEFSSYSARLFDHCLTRGWTCRSGKALHL